MGGSIGDLIASLTLDDSGFSSGLANAQGALSEFANVAGGVFAGMGASNLFDSLTSGIGNFISNVVGTSSDLQSYGQTFDSIMQGIGNSSDTMGTAVSASAAKAKVSALEAQDALQKYNEKVQEIQDNIATVMSGQNISDAEKKFADQMASIQEQYAQKVQQIDDEIASADQDLQQTLLDNKQRATDTLADMQAEHDNQMADKKEQQALTISQTTSAVEKAALQKKYDEENKLAEDSYQRKYKLKQQIEDRTIKEEDAKAQASHDKRVTMLKEELSREATLEQEKEDKLKTQEATEISRLESENAKKLAMYKRELADEERAYQLSVARRNAQALSGGGRGAAGGLMNLTPLGTGDAFAQQAEDVNKLIAQVQTFATGNGKGWLGAPFTEHDILDADQRILAFGGNVQKLNPIIGNLAGTFHTSFGTSMIAVIDGMTGNMRMLEHQFGISRQQLEGINGGPLKSQEQYLEAISKIVENPHGKFFHGMQNDMQTLPGIMSNIEDQTNRVFAAFMGLDDNLKPIKGGLFDDLLKGLTAFSTYLASHREQIFAFARNFGNGLVTVGKIVLDIAGFFQKHWKVIEDILIGIGVMLAIAFGPEILAAIGSFLATMAVVSATIVVLGVVFGALGAVVKTVFNWIVDGIKWVAQNWKNIWGEIQKLIGQFTSFFTSHIDIILAFLGPAGWLVLAFMAVHDHWNTIVQAVKKFLGEFGDFFTNLAHAIIGAAITFITNEVNGWKNLASDIVNAWKGVLDFFGGMFDKLKQGFKEVGDAILNSHLNPFHHGSPSLVELVENGVKQIKMQYESIGDIRTPGISGFASGMGNMGSYSSVYNSQQNLRTANMTFNNAFVIKDQASAMNMAEFLAFQSEHFGTF